MFYLGFGVGACFVVLLLIVLGMMKQSKARSSEFGVCDTFNTPHEKSDDCENWRES